MLNGAKDDRGAIWDKIAKSEDQRVTAGKVWGKIAEDFQRGEVGKMWDRIAASFTAPVSTEVRQRIEQSEEQRMAEQRVPRP